MVFKALIECLLGIPVISFIYPHTECAMIVVSACMIGTVSSVDALSILVKSSKFDRSDCDDSSCAKRLIECQGAPAWTATWKIRQSCKQIRVGDIACLLEGSSFPTVIRPCGSHFDIIIITLTSTPATVYTQDVPESRYNYNVPPIRGHELVKTWFADCSARPRHQVSLVWDWQPATADLSKQHNDIWDEIDRTESTNFAVDSGNTNAALLRKLNYERVLDDVGNEYYGRRTRSEERPNSLPETSLKAASHQHAQLAVVLSSPPSQALKWLASYTKAIRHCIRLLNRGLDSRMPDARTPGDLLYRWAHESRFDYGILGLVDMERAARSGSSADDAHLSVQAPHCLFRTSQLYWEFGERQHNDILMSLFPAYREASHRYSLDTAGHQLIFNGRYLIRLILTHESIPSRGFLDCVVGSEDSC
jgi:hypothetical protein